MKAISADKKKMLFACYLAIFWCMFIFVVVINSIPLNPFSIRYHTPVYKVLPEGFGFFTRDPREDVVKAYQMGDGSYQFVSCRASEASNLFGLSRRSRKRNVELAALMKSVPDTAWQNGDVSRFTMDCDSVIVVKSDIRNPELSNCKLLLVKQERTPWSWAGREDLIMPYKKIVLSIR